MDGPILVNPECTTSQNWTMCSTSLADEMLRNADADVHTPMETHECNFRWAGFHTYRSKWKRHLFRERNSMILLFVLKCQVEDQVTYVRCTHHCNLAHRLQQVRRCVASCSLWNCLHSNAFSCCCYCCYSNERKYWTAATRMKVLNCW